MNPEKPNKLILEQEDWLIIHKILSEFVPGIQVFAFGSRVTQKAKPFSDLDLALLTEKPISLKLHGSLLQAFSDSRLPFRVDVVDVASIDAGFKKQIFQQAIRIF